MEMSMIQKEKIFPYMSEGKTSLEEMEPQESEGIKHFKNIKK